MYPQIGLACFSQLLAIASAGSGPPELMNASEAQHAFDRGMGMARWRAENAAIAVFGTKQLVTRHTLLEKPGGMVGVLWTVLWPQCRQVKTLCKTASTVMMIGV